MAKLGVGDGDEAKPGSISPLPTWLFTNYLVTDTKELLFQANIPT